MDEYTRRREVLVRIAELLAQMPEDVVRQLVQRWESELNEMLANTPTTLSYAETETHTIYKTIPNKRHKLSPIEDTR